MVDYDRDLQFGTFISFPFKVNARLRDIRTRDQEKICPCKASNCFIVFLTTDPHYVFNERIGEKLPFFASCLYDSNVQAVFSCDIIDLSALTSLKSLYLVAAARFPVTLLLNLAKTLTLPETHLKELKLLIDDNLEGKDWTQDGMAGEAVDDPKSWRDLDALITRMLRMHKDTVIDFMSAPTNMPVDIDELAEFGIRMFPTASKRKRFRFLDLQFRTCE